MIKFALGIPHTPWVEARVATYDALRASLGTSGYVACRTFEDRAANHEWSETLWKWGVNSGGTHLLQLQDDVEVCPDFWLVLRALVTAFPDHVIGLHSPKVPMPPPPGANVYTTSDGLIGTGYVVPVSILQDFLEWRSRVSPEGVENLGEDTLLGLYCYDRGLSIVHPSPSFIRHNVNLPSTYGNDEHEGRKPRYPVAFDDTASLTEMQKEEMWAWEPLPPPQRFYTGTHDHALRYIPDFSKERFFQGQREVAIQNAVRTAMNTAFKPKIVIATPTRDGMLTELYLHTVIQLSKWPEVEVMQVSTYDDDVDRARSRQVRRFLEGTGTHLLFIDADVGFTPDLVAGMLRANLVGGHDYVAAAYPRRHIYWDRAAGQASAELAEAKAYNYPVRLLNPSMPSVDKHHCAEVAGSGMGATLLSRAMLERMTAHYGDPGDLTFFDTQDEKLTVCLFYRGFHMGDRNDPDLPSEDYAFGIRWRKLGGKVMLYLGPGAPASHAGMHVYQGRPEAFGIRTEPIPGA